ncbi:replication protein A 70 kDa DNA-binding subunit D-like [Forsythia ovata]|uniref:Replication protein A 70 kDa DNA-binding subunit D-like n=1 Tax=Forsythia ovata TaxID=205694 RepID=A0ABD1RYW5_9LAMI
MEQKYRDSMGPIQWTIYGKTKVQPIDEDHCDLLFSTYRLVSFNNQQYHMDTKSEIDILGVVIDVLPKNLVQTKFQRESCIQEIVLINEKFETTFLTVWDEFVVNECKIVTTMVGATPIILARNLRVSSFNENHDILNDIRASTTEEHMLYLKVINNNKKTAALKYDVVFMLEPILDINTALNIGENSVRDFMVEEKSAYRTCINKQPIKAYALPVLSPIDPVSGRQNAKHTCFKTNTVIASRNITDLRLVANIANQSDVLSADY